MAMPITGSSPASPTSPGLSHNTSLTGVCLGTRCRPPDAASPTHAVLSSLPRASPPRDPLPRSSNNGALWPPHHAQLDLARLPRQAVAASSQPSFPSTERMTARPRSPTGSSLPSVSSIRADGSPSLSCPAILSNRGGSTKTTTTTLCSYYRAASPCVYYMHEYSFMAEPCKAVCCPSRAAPHRLHILPLAHICGSRPLRFRSDEHVG